MFVTEYKKIPNVVLNYIVSDLSNTKNMSHSMVSTVFNKPVNKSYRPR